MIADRFETFLIDLDGVVYLGEEAMPGAVESLRRLREENKRLRFLTNDPRPTRREVVRRLGGMGIRSRVDEVVTCGWATARFLAERDLRSCYVVGTEGLRHEIESAGVRSAERGAVDAVVVGCSEDVGYRHIRRAARLIRRGARFVATNADPTFPTPDGPAPATGTIVAAVRTASDRSPRIVGKPERPMFRAALDGCDSGEAVMVGDSPATDIAGAHAAGLPAVLLARDGTSGSGGTPAAAPTPSIRPDATVESLADLFDGGRSVP